MLKQITLLALGLSLTACGKATITLSGGSTIKIDTSGMNPLGSQAAFGEVQSCASGSNLIASGIGNSAFCMDLIVKTAATHTAAVQACGSNGQSVCSIPQLVTACLAGKTSTALYWTSNAAANTSPSAYVVDGSVCGNGGLSGAYVGTSSKAYYCCSN